MAWAISGLARMHPFSFSQYFDPVHVLLQSFLKLHLAMSSFSSLSLKLHLELSFLPSACITFHTSPFRITSSLSLTVTKPCCTWIRHPSSLSTLIDIRLYRASRTYRTASRACTVPSLHVTLTVRVPVTSQASHPPFRQSFSLLRSRS